MLLGDPTQGRSARGHDGAEIGAVDATPRLDRAHVAAIIQQVPSEAYDLAIRRTDPVTGTAAWAHGAIGDADGHEVLATIDGGQVCLRLDDIEDIARHFAISLPDDPSGSTASRRSRHGLLVVSPHTTVRLAPARGDGRLHIFQGNAAGPTGIDAADLHWRAGEVATLTTGDAMLMAVTLETEPPRRRALSSAIGAGFRRLLAAVMRRPSGAAAPRTERGTARLDFRLVRSRHALRAPT